ncbi:MAG: glycosyltransferase family 2 protein [Candidatus Neoclostridium sp.]
MENVSFSVIIPVYNVEKYLSECVRSVLCQPYRNIEVILVDDGSTDGSKAICDELARSDGRVKVIHKQNGGADSARKAGAKKASGDYVVCVDGDDCVSDGIFSLYADAIAKSGADVVCSAAKWKYPDCEKTVACSAKEGVYDKERIKKEIFPFLIENEKGEYFSPSLWAKAFKREPYVKAQLSTPDCVKIGEDNACTKPIIAAAEKLCVISQSTYVYRINPGSVTQKRKPFDLYEPKLVCGHFEKTIPMTADLQAQVYRCAVHYLFNAAVTQYYAGDDKAAKANIKNALEDEYYVRAVKNCRFAPFTKGAMAKFALKSKAFWLIRAYAKLKTR